MKKDIEMPKVEGVEVAIVNEGEVQEDDWKVYLLNKNNHPIETVLVSSKGYGQYKGDQKKTSVLRQLIGDVAPKDYALIEPIDPELFKLSNEYWVSYYVGRKLYDKKYVFVAESVSSEHFTDIKMLGMKGVLHS